MPETWWSGFAESLKFSKTAFEQVFDDSEHIALMQATYPRYSFEELEEMNDAHFHGLLQHIPTIERRRAEVIADEVASVVVRLFKK